MEEGLSSPRVRISFCHLLVFWFLFLLTFDCPLITFSVLPLQNKIRERRKGARIFGILSAVEASFGAASIILCQCAGATERAGLVNQRNDGFRPHGIKFFFG